MFGRDRCCLDLHYQIHPAAKHLVDFLPFSLKCSLLMTIIHAHIQYAQNTSSVFLLRQRKRITRVQMFDYKDSLLLLPFFCPFHAVHIIHGLMLVPGSAYSEFQITASFYVDVFRISFTTSAVNSSCTCGLFSRHRIYAFLAKSG